MTITRILNDGNPFPVKKDCYYDQKSLLSCRWITVPGRSGDTPVVMEFHLDFEIQQSCAFRFHVSADQQYILEVDGKYAGRGCEMKSPENWFFSNHTKCAWRLAFTVYRPGSGITAIYHL